jgi:hypothetical protein
MRGPDSFVAADTGVALRRMGRETRQTGSAVWRLGRARAALAGIACLGGLSGAAHAQVVVATVVDSAARIAMPNAIVSLEDASGTRVVAELTDAAGVAALRAPSGGRYAIRVDRSGMTTFRSAGVQLSAGDTLRLTLRVPVQARSLEAVRVVAASACAASASAGDIGSVWDAARTALFTSQRGSELLAPAVRVARFERSVDQHGRVIEERVDTMLVRSAEPFRTLTPDVISRDGYRLQGETVDLLFAPDARTLLSEEFARDHCFQLVGDPRTPELIGLNFSPTPGREVVDIAGTFWLDRETSALQRVEYRYRNAGPDADASGAGGELVFGEIAAGVRGIAGWTVRTPWVTTARVRGARGELSARDTLVGVREEGALLSPAVLTVANAVPASDRSTGSIVGVIRDASTSRGGLPVARAVVLGLGRGALTDSLGRFRITRVPAGPATIRVDHERLRLYRVASRVDLEVKANDSVFVALQVPTGREAVAALCPQGAADVEGRGVLVARVVDAALGHGVSNASALATWRGRLIPTFVRSGAERAESNEIGHVVMCGLSAAVPVRITVAARGYRRGALTVPISPGDVTEREIRLMPCAPGDHHSLCPDP